MARRVALVSLLVADYDEAIAFYVGKLGFTLVEDTDMGHGKRWVVVSPGTDGTDFLLARATGDSYYLERTRENLACFRQFIAREDGDFNAWRGMASERYYQTDCFAAKGMLLTLSHAWSVGILLYACEAALELPELA